jgi:hypothetical protein
MINTSSSAPKRYYFWSVVYLLVQTSLGFLLHPYQTIQTLVALGGQSFARLYQVLLIITPALYYFLTMLIWRLGLRALVSYFLPASCPLMVIKTCLVFFALYWQLCLLYLYGKFTWAQKKGQRE